MDKDLNSKNLVLTGLMGTGKSTVGRLLADQIGRQFVDTDQHIDAHFGPVERIFDGPDGDQQYQLIEEQVAAQLSQRHNLVIATGGRFMINQRNIDALSGGADIVCLQAELEELVARLLAADADTFRPRFDKAENKLALMKQLDQQGKPFYAQFYQVQTTGKHPATVAAEIRKWHFESGLFRV